MQQQPLFGVWCAGCARELTGADFYVKPNGRPRKPCKQCLARRSAAFFAAHPEKQAEYRKAALARDPERVREYGRQYRKRTPEKQDAKRRRWRSENPERYRELSARGNAKAEAARRAAAACVYFVLATESDCVKIGFSKSSAEHRLRNLQVGSPEPLALLGWVPAESSADEAALHRRFAHLRKRGEWFRAAPDLLAYIDEHTRHGQEAERCGVPQAQEAVGG